MPYGIRLATGEVQLITEGTALTNAQADGLMGGAAEIVWVDGRGTTTVLEMLSPRFDSSANDEGNDK